jgi:hypothetical protein
MDKSALREIHLPPEIGLWPLAPGWWAVILLLIALALFFAIRDRPRRLLRQTAFRELQALAAAYAAHKKPAALVADISILLRRLALARLPRQAIAGIHGEEWLKELDRLGNTGSGFSRGIGRVLLEGPYGGQPPADPEMLIGLVKRWIRGAL